MSPAYCTPMKYVHIFYKDRPATNDLTDKSTGYRAKFQALSLSVANGFLTIVENTSAGPGKVTNVSLSVIASWTEEEAELANGPSSAPAEPANRRNDDIRPDPEKISQSTPSARRG